MNQRSAARSYITTGSQKPLLHGELLARDCIVNVFATAPVLLSITTTVETAWFVAWTK